MVALIVAEGLSAQRLMHCTHTLAYMQSEHFSKGEAREFCTPTGFDRAYWASVWVSRALSRLSTRVDLPPTVELPTDRPLIIAANHSSLFDLLAALIVMGNYGVPARIAVNERFFSSPVGGSVLRRIGCIPFSRDNREEAEQTMVDALLAHQVCAMMPEGKIIRNDDQFGGVGPGRPGISRVARQAGAAVLPVGFAASERAWKPGRPLPRIANIGHPVVVRFGNLMTFDTDDHIANAERLMEAISGLVLEGRGESVS